LELQANEFFNQLDTFTKRYAKTNVPRAVIPSVWGKSELNLIDGAIIHFTADTDLHSVLRWFCDPGFDSKVSAHVIVANIRMPDHDLLSQGLPLIENLPVTVLQCRMPNQGAYHATWVNSSYYGIECLNAGILTEKQGKYFNWDDKAWSVPGKVPVKVRGSYWEPYTAGQVAMVVALLRYIREYSKGAVLNKALEITMKPALILGHENVQRNKSDPGPTFPLREVRQAAFEDGPIDAYSWYRDLQAGRLAGATQADLDLRYWLSGIYELAELPDSSQIPELLNKLRVKCPSSIRLALWLLGYEVPNNGDRTSTDYTEVEKMDIAVFQKMMGLKVDGEPGEKTCTALATMLKERKIIS